jgi:hypothetical protein
MAFESLNFTLTKIIIYHNITFNKLCYPMCTPLYL